MGHRVRLTLSEAEARAVLLSLDNTKDDMYAVYHRQPVFEAAERAEQKIRAGLKRPAKKPKEKP